MALTFGSLFAGIGGFDLGLERSGMVCKWQVEIDDYARRVLEKHWPSVPRWDDVRTFLADGNVGPWCVDAIAAGFPCQNLSNAGDKTGINGSKSGLWKEVVRCVRLLRPRFIILENVPEITRRGLDEVIGALVQSGYDTWHDCIPSAFVGGDSWRERFFLIAELVCVGREVVLPCLSRTYGKAISKTEWKSNSFDTRFARLEEMERRFSEPSLLRTNDGVSCIVDRIRCLGNAVDPRVAEFIGRLIVESTPESEAMMSEGISIELCDCENVILRAVAEPQETKEGVANLIADVEQMARELLTLRRADAGDEEVSSLEDEILHGIGTDYFGDKRGCEDARQALSKLIDIATTRGQQLRDERDRSRRLNVTCDELHESIREKESEIEKCHDQVVKAESLVLTVQAENGQLEKQLRSSREEVERMKEQIASSDESLRLERSITDQQHQEQRDELVGLLKKCDKWFGLTDKMIVLKNSFGTDLESLQDASKFLEIVSAGEVAK